MSTVKGKLPVSVVIPCFNCADTIKPAVYSIASQTRLPAEVILVEDGSANDTINVLRELELQYSDWIRVVVLKKNQGAASARNAGWLLATQNYVAFLDADDTWHPDKLHIQYEYMRKNPEIALSGHQCVFLERAGDLPAIPINIDVTPISAKSLLIKNAFSTPTVMLKRDISIRFQEDKRFAEDLLLWQKIAFSGLRVVRIEAILAYVHKPVYGAGGLSGQLWEMEKGELSNFLSLYRSQCINGIFYIIACAFSIIKFSKRLLIFSTNYIINIVFYFFK